MSSSNGLFKDLPGAPSSAAPISNSAADPAPEIDVAGDEALTELSMLKQRASLMGIKHSNNIKAETLKGLISAKLAGEEEAQKESERQAQEAAAAELARKEAETRAAIAAAGATKPAVDELVNLALPAAPDKEKSLREQLMESEMALVRCRITNLDPKKKDLPGEIFTVANEYIGTVRKYIPYGEQSDDGWHVPMCIFRQLQERTFVSITVPKKDGREGHPVMRDAREFSLEVLPPLTEEELAQLAATQAAAGII